MLRDAGRAPAWRAAGALPVVADLDDRGSLQRVTGLADCVLHLAPPPGEGRRDQRTRNLLAALGKGKSLPRRLIYVSTTGIYGDCGGAQIDETRRVNAESARAGRRLDAERCLRAWGRRTGVDRFHPARPRHLRRRPPAGGALAQGLAGADRRRRRVTPTTFTPTIWPPPASRRCGTGGATAPTMWSMIPISGWPSTSTVSPLPSSFRGPPEYRAAKLNNACRRCRCPSCANRGASATGA